MTLLESPALARASQSGPNLARLIRSEIAKIRKIQTGNQVDGITGGLAVKDQDKEKDKGQK